MTQEKKERLLFYTRTAVGIIQAYWWVIVIALLYVATGVMYLYRTYRAELQEFHDTRLF